MSEVSIRDLRNHGGEVIDRVEQGERLTITRDGRRVAELRPIERRPLKADVLIERWGYLDSIPMRFTRTLIRRSTPVCDRANYPSTPSTPMTSRASKGSICIRSPSRPNLVGDLTR